MKITNFLRTLTAACAIATTAYAGAAPILLVDGNGNLTGAKNLEVAGKMYNVTFSDGSCNSLFDGCAVSAFTFSSQSSAAAAASALLDNVFIDSASGLFDSDASKTFGCTRSICTTLIPYGLTTYNSFLLSLVDNNSAPLDDGFDFGLSSANFIDTTGSGLLNFAVFEIASPAAAEVPEPDSIALIGLSLAGLAFARRRKA